MPLEGEELDELLNGFLDGELTAKELELVQGQLQDHETVRLRLQELSDLKNDLKQCFAAVKARNGAASTDAVSGDDMSPGASSSALVGRSFADHIIAEARKQAIATGLPSTHHVLRAVSRPSSSSVESIVNVSGAHVPAAEAASHSPVDSGWVKAAGIVAALAAAIFAAVYLPGHFERGASVEQIAENSPNPLAPDVRAAPPAFSNGSSDPAEETAQVRYVSELNLANQILLVFDVEQSADAAQQNALQSILRKYNLLEERPIVADAAIEKAISDARMTVVPTEESGGDAILYFIRADMNQLGQALDEIYFRRLDFPKVALDLAMDNSSARLMETIAKSTGMRFAQSDAFAVPLSVSAEDGDGTPLRGVQAPATFVSSVSREKGFNESGMAMASPSGELSTVMLIVRSPNR